jgi:DNA-binding transcriptional MocR family regulator
MAKSKAYRRSGGYVQKWEEILSSPAYRDLKPVARCLIEEFQRLYRPGRNGQLSISTKNASRLLNVTEPTAIKAFKEVEAHGFIKLSEGHRWTERKAREWRLTFEPGNNNQEPTDEWRDWQPKNNHRPKKQGQDCSKNNSRLLKKQGQGGHVCHIREQKNNSLRG